MKSQIFTLISILLYLTSALQIEEPLSFERNIDFNNDWEFVLSPSTEWTKIDLPHDFSISQPLNEDLEGESGFYPGGTGNYRKKFTLAKPIEGEVSAILYFYGSYKDTYVYVNQNYVGENHYGYNSFAFDIAEYLIMDGVTENVIEVKVEHELFSSRFYSGSGIFRDVTLSILNKVHVALDGVKITTPDIKTGKGTVNIETEIENKKDEDDAKVILDITITNRKGEVVATYKTPEATDIPVSETVKINSVLNIENPQLWSDKTPNFYLVTIKILENGKEIDKYSDRFGFRYYSFTDKGFILNGKPTKLNGVSIHHDYGAIGSIDNYDAIVKRFNQLQDMGINSIRTTHNIASKKWIELSDELGLIVVEESFDGWSYSKNGNKNDFGKYFLVNITSRNQIIGGNPKMQWYEFALRSMIKRDRNNPSIIMWSIGNEIQANAYIDETYPIYCANMIKWGKELDDTRPFTTGDNSIKFLPNKYNKEISKILHDNGGVIGYNYALGFQLSAAVKKFGSVYLSESASAINSRGTYSLDYNGFLRLHDGKYHLTSYDNSWVIWGTTAHTSMWWTLTNDYVSGQYVWTGFDYIGEPTPWNGMYPGSESGEGPIPNSAYFGIIDTAGFPKDTYYLYRAQLNRESSTVHIVSAWDKNNMCFHGLTEKRTPVVIYTNAHLVELYRSDKETPICQMKRTVQVTEQGHVYYTYETESKDDSCEAVEPGFLSVGKELYGSFRLTFVEGTKLFTKAYDENMKLIDKSKIVGTHEVAAPKLDKIKMEVNLDKNEVKADGKSLVYVEVIFKDDEGMLNTRGEYNITFTLEGEGKILGVDNGDQGTTKKFQQAEALKSSKLAYVNAFAGKALAIVSSTKQAGNIKLSVSSEFGTQNFNIKTK